MCDDIWRQATGCDPLIAAGVIMAVVPIAWRPRGGLTLRKEHWREDQQKYPRDHIKQRKLY